MTYFSGIPVSVSEFAVTTRVSFTIERLRKRRKRYVIRRNEWVEPCAFLINGASIGLGGFLPQPDRLVVHPEIYTKMKEVK